jgi:Na+/H+-dicarboxylate symporter
MRFTLRVLLSLLLGLLVGVAVSHLPSQWMRVPAFLEPIGTMYINTIRVAVIPMVMSGLIVGVASAGGGSQIRSLGARALVLMFISLAAAVLFSGALAMFLFSKLNADASLAARFERHSAAPNLSLAKWFVDLVPSNIVAALADGSLLPLVIFSIAFGLALTQVEEERRARVVGRLQGICDAFVALLKFIVSLAPIGVFALAVPLAARTGIGAVGTLAYYVVTMSAILMLFLALILYPAVLIFGRVSLLRFSRAASPSQVVAFTSRSSMASLPVAYTGARELGLSEQSCNFFLPLAASVFRVGGAMQQVVGVLFLAKVSGISLDSGHLATLALSSIATSLTIPGVPGGSILVMAPALASVGVPVAGMAILMAVDSIPDMFRTVANVTPWVAASAILARGRDELS